MVISSPIPEFYVTASTENSFCNQLILFASNKIAIQDIKTYQVNIALLDNSTNVSFNTKKNKQVQVVKKAANKIDEILAKLVL